MNLSEKLVIITGGTKGIGKSLVHRFVSEGWSVATCARNGDDLNELRNEIHKKYDVLIYTFIADISKKEEVARFVEFIQMTTKTVEILINNVGMFIQGLVHEEEEGTLEKMMDTNLYSAYYLSRAIIPQMKHGKSGHIFNLCSVASLKAYPNGGSYSISKFALYGLSQALREELREYGIRVTSILAGAVKTPSWNGVEIPDERFIKSEDIAETIYSTYRLSERTVVEDIVIRPQLGDI